jgi:hypothetical protein
MAPSTRQPSADARLFAEPALGHVELVRGRALSAPERAVGWLIGVPFASWRYMARTIEIRRETTSCSWPLDGFPEDDHGSFGEPDALQRASAGCGAAFHRLYRVRVEQPLLDAHELITIILNDPNVACPLEIARFERQDASRPIEVGDEMRVRLPGAWNGPVRATDVTDRSFRLATLRGHMEAGEIEFRAHDDDSKLAFEIESWARSSDPVFDFLYDRLGIARELQTDMWAFFLERVAQISGGSAANGIEVLTRRCDDHPL